MTFILVNLVNNDRVIASMMLILFDRKNNIQMISNDYSSIVFSCNIGSNKAIWKNGGSIQCCLTRSLNTGMG